MEKVSEERLNELLEKESKYNKSKERSIYYSRRRNVRLSLLAKKAIEMGLSVSEEEIDSYMSK